MDELFLPTLHTFAMNNVFTGSSGMLRFRIKPNVVMATAKEVDFQESTIFVEYWHGLFCYEKSMPAEQINVEQPSKKESARRHSLSVM